ncbi:hypothetical protein FZC33_03210 [Labrys sp. KNU-23]|uniref:hypothetical protein n=1 Tax=Labrys sp. KNU-23 TaxID=2789216 RepID=UPI0011EE8C6D|nr:hypothetical protein [Labrys sp. KNU-23]QEN85270.1 hypothetical protein FZC33_03210 [Labrys sp. KNU-23]
MPHASYRIIGTADGWVIEHEGQRGGGYELPEAAFETAVAAASLDLKQRRNVNISVEFPESPEDSEALASESEPARQRGQFDNLTDETERR